MQSFARDSLDGYDCFAVHVLHSHRTRPHGFAVQMNSACSAQPHTAAKLSSWKVRDIAQIPQQRHAGIAVECLLNTIYFQMDHFVSSTRQEVCEARVNGNAE